MSLHQRLDVGKKKWSDVKWGDIYNYLIETLLSEYYFEEISVSELCAKIFQSTPSVY